MQHYVGLDVSLKQTAVCVVDPAGKTNELIDGQPALAAAVEPLLKAREVLARQIAGLDRKLLRLARGEPQVRRFMTVPGDERASGL